jgi:hypothetical protein
MPRSQNPPQPQRGGMEAPLASAATSHAAPLGLEKVFGELVCYKRVIPTGFYIG